MQVQEQQVQPPQGRGHLIEQDLAEALRPLVDNKSVVKALIGYLVELRLVEHRKAQQVDFTKGADYVALHAARLQGVNWVVDMMLAMEDTVKLSIDYWQAQKGDTTEET